MTQIATITIPKELARTGDLVLVPRKDYEKFLAYRLRNVKTFKPTAAEKKALARARREFKEGNYVTLKQLEDELDSLRRE